MTIASDKAQVVKDEKAAERAYQAEKTSVATVVRAWAAGLTPQNAPEAKLKGPLAWVRETKAEELIQALKKAGHS